MLKQYLNRFITLFSFTLFNLGFAQTSVPTINLLSWWGYLSEPWVNELIYEQCNVLVSADEYYSNTEFLSRWRGNEDYYDVIIFDDTIYNAVKEKVALTKGNFHEKAQQYYPPVREKYFELNMPPNVAFLNQAVTGFLWNPKKIKLDDFNTDNIFDKVGSNIFIMIDDPTEASEFLFNYTDGDSFTPENFQKLVGKSKVYITNELGELLYEPDFALAYLWSAEAMLHINSEGHHYEFHFHDDVSSISSEMVAILNFDTEHASCVGELLASKPFLEQLQNEYFFLNPFGSIDNIEDTLHREIFERYLAEFSNLKWSKLLSKQEFYDYNQVWKQINVDVISNGH